MSWIEVRLTPSADGGTRFELEHIAHVDDERWGSSARARSASAGTSG